MEVSQFTYFQQVGGLDCNPVSTELTYGLERLAMYVQGIENVYDLDFDGVPKDQGGKTYGDIFHQAEVEYSTYNFERATTEILLRRFADAEAECGNLVAAKLPLQAYDPCLDRQSVVSGKRVCVRVDVGGRRMIKKKNKKT